MGQLPCGMGLTDSSFSTAVCFCVIPQGQSGALSIFSGQFCVHESFLESHTLSTRFGEYAHRYCVAIRSCDVRIQKAGLFTADQLVAAFFNACSLCPNSP
jgi:hypothetical protein